MSGDTQEARIEGYPAEDVETGEMLMQSRLTGKSYRVTKWVETGDEPWQFVALEKEEVEHV